MNKDHSKPKRQNAYRDAHQKEEGSCCLKRSAMPFILTARGGRFLDHSSRVGAKLKIAIAIVARSPAFGCSY